MTEQKKRFADKYFETLNGSQSAIFAGYSKKTSRQIAHNLLQEDEVEEYLQLLRSTAAEKSGINRDWVMERFKEISDRCVQEVEPVTIQGIPTGEYKFDSSGANKATEMLGKIIGVFEKDNSQKSVAVSVTVTKEEAKQISEDLENEF